MRFFKYHALGNDYLVLVNELFSSESEANADRFSPELIRFICERNRGLGSDGILIGERSKKKTGFTLRILNPDGSEAEKSGNGLRIFARHLRNQGKVGAEPFTVHTLGGVVTCEISEDASAIAVEMGRVSFRSDEVPVKVEGEAREVLDEPIEVADVLYL